MASPKTIKSIIKVMLSVIGSMALLFFSFLMFQIIWPYRTGETDIDFLLTKQEVIHFLHYRLSFYLHIFPSLLVLVAGLTQFSNWVLKNNLGIHRWVGRLYVFIILIVSGPAALLMSFYANGGVISKLGFIFLSLLWWFFTFLGLSTIRKGNVEVHKKWMIRSYALTLSAVSLRTYQFLINSFFFIDPELVYTFLSWFSWVGNLIIAELIISAQKKSRFQIN